MKKFTLLFSLFVALVTTAFASQATVNDEAETVEFGVQKIYNNPATFISAVLVEFTKDVEVVMPEGGLSVLNEKGESVAKITSYIGYQPNVINFQFEKTEVEGKDGKIELQDTYITEPGTYTLAFPAGTVKSVDGEDFTETLTLTVAIPFEVKMVNPTENTEYPVENIALQGTKDLQVTWPEGGLSVKDKDGNVVAQITNQPIQPVSYGIMLMFDQVEVEGKDGKTEMQSVVISEPGTYTLEVPQGVIKSTEGEDFEGTFTFTIYVPEPVITISPSENESLTEIKDIVIEIKNAEVTCDVTKEVTAYLGGTGFTGTVSHENNVITISFDEALTEEGECRVSIPNGLFTVNGEPNGQQVITYTISQATPLEFIVEPAVGEVGQIETIKIIFNQIIKLAMDENWQMISREIDLVDSKGNKIKLTAIATGGNVNYIEYANAEWDGYKDIITNITEPETYTLDLSQIVVNYGAYKYIDEWDYENTGYKATGTLSGTYTWTVTGDTAIEGVDAEDGEQVIYDLTGRKIDNITKPGIYIVNGNKVLVK